MLEPFSLDKLRRGIERALADRPVPAGSIDRLTAEIEEVVWSEESEVSADDLGDQVLFRLRNLDEVAYLRYASVYKEFSGASDFEREVAAMESDT